MNRNGLDLQVTTIEQTFVDVLHRIESSGGWEEVSRSLDNIASIDINDLIDYCLFFNNDSLAAKVGYFLQRREGAFSPSQKQLERLLKHKPKSVQYIGKRNSESHKLVKKWNIMLPKAVVENSWE